MPRRFLSILWLAAWLVVGSTPGQAEMRDGGPDLTGRWVLIGKTDVDAQFAVIDIKSTDGTLTVEVVDAFLRHLKPKVYLERSAESFVLVVAYDQGDVTLKGPLPVEDRPQKIPGVFRFGLADSAAALVSAGRMERTEADRIVAPQDEKPQPETAGSLLVALLQHGKGLTEFNDKRYAALDLRIARVVARDVKLDATTETQAWATRRLIEASKRSGTPDLAAETRLAALKARIADENRADSAPMKVEPFAGRADPVHDRVVLMELFTGAECGGCIAAEIAADALIQAYRPTELIVLQHHLHIPGPDPLTNPHTVESQNAYEVRGAPSTYFNGKPLAGGGGSKTDVRRKLNQYRQVIDELLGDKKQATIELKATRTGDEIRIVTSARLLSEVKPGDPAPRLRLALVEDEVIYEGGNRQKCHRNVVRAMPGGASGKPLVEGQARVEEVVSIAEIRTTLERYLEAYPDQPDSRGPFPRALPPIALETLSVVAFVQGPDNHVLHAVILPIR